MISQFVSETEDFNYYLNDLKTQSAVERQLAVIGEAANKFEKMSGSGLQNSSQIISLRNRIIHAYDSIDSAIIWAILKNHVPLLESEVRELLQRR